jgi:TrpR-related protein YerC/YecD
MKKVSATDVNSLYKAIQSLRDLGEARRFFRDLLTAAEIDELARRWKAARLLSQGVPYTRIVDETGLSSTTVARVSRWVKKGAGGYRLVIRRLSPKK